LQQTEAGASAQVTGQGTDGELSEDELAGVAGGYGYGDNWPGFGYGDMYYWRP
jgi:uncharacterized protein with beta-barrel porin domain